MKLNRMIALVALYTVPLLAQIDLFMSGKVFLEDNKEDANVTVSTTFEGLEYRHFMTCGLGDGAIVCENISERMLSNPKEFTYYSVRKEYFNEIWKAKEDDMLFLTDEEIKEHKNKNKKGHEDTIVEYFEYEYPIFEKDGIVSVVVIGDEQSTRGENSYTTYKDGKRVKLRVDDRSLYKKINKGFHDSVLKIDENCKFFIFKDKLYVYDPNIEFSYGRYGKSKSYFAFDVPDIEQYLIPVEE
ncbi:MAG: hypothetical protein ACTTJS_00170 [Wolinella sp.]